MGAIADQVAQAVQHVDASLLSVSQHGLQSEYVAMNVAEGGYSHCSLLGCVGTVWWDANRGDDSSKRPCAQTGLGRGAAQNSEGP
jgi:hypothetical protein